MKQFITGCLALFLIGFTSCSSTKTGNDIKALNSTEWQLSVINGKPADADNYNSGLPEANFSADNKIAGNGGCNRYGGSYKLTGNGKLTVGPFISTKMYCPGQGESNYLKALQESTMLKVGKGKLTLLNGETEVLVFVPKT